MVMERLCGEDGASGGYAGDNGDEASIGDGCVVGRQRR